MWLHLYHFLTRNHIKGANRLTGTMTSTLGSTMITTSSLSPGSVGGEGDDPPSPRSLSPRKTNEESENEFLQSLVTRPPGSLAANLVNRMRKVVREDRGRYEVVDTAVYASIAALIKVMFGAYLACPFYQRISLLSLSLYSIMV